MPFKGVIGLKLGMINLCNETITETDQLIVTYLNDVYQSVT